MQLQHLTLRRWFQKVQSVFSHNVKKDTSHPFRQPTNLNFYSHRNQYPKFCFVTYVVYYQTYNMATERTQIKGIRQTYRKICTAIYLHPVALSFVNIIVAQIWLIATIFGLLMHHGTKIQEKPNRVQHLHLLRGQVNNTYINRV